MLRQAADPGSAVKVHALGAYGVKETEIDAFILWWRQQRLASERRLDAEASDSGESADLPSGDET